MESSNHQTFQQWMKFNQLFDWMEWFVDLFDDGWWNGCAAPSLSCAGCGLLVIGFHSSINSNQPSIKLINLSLFVKKDWLKWKQREELIEFGLGVKPITHYRVIKRFIFYGASKPNKSTILPLLSFQRKTKVFFFISANKRILELFCWMELKRYYNSN